MGSAGIVLVVVVATLVAVAHGQDYCALCRDHTMCLYTGVGAKCSPYVTGGVSTTEQATLLHALNTQRQKVAQGQERRGAPGPQPAAANMRKLVWSPELATVAQRWAEQCDFSTDKCRSVSEFRYVGQGVYRSSTTGSTVQPDWKGVVDQWYNHVAEFNKSFISPYQWGPGGMYSQVVWADTYQVGCGYVVYKDRRDDEWTHQFYVCNYGPGGNRVGGSVYKQGSACSKCPAGTSCSRDQRYPALCSS